MRGCLRESRRRSAQTSRDHRTFTSVYLTNSCPPEFKLWRCAHHICPLATQLCTPDLSEPISPLRNSRTSAQEYPPLATSWCWLPWNFTRLIRWCSAFTGNSQQDIYGSRLVVVNLTSLLTRSELCFRSGNAYRNSVQPDCRAQHGWSDRRFVSHR